MVSHHRGLGTCSRKHGAVGLATRPGSGFERVQNVVEWAGEGRVALVCVRNGHGRDPPGACCSQEGPSSHGSPAVPGQEEGVLSRAGGEGPETQRLSSEPFQGCVPGWPQPPKKTLTVGKLERDPKHPKGYVVTDGSGE